MAGPDKPESPGNASSGDKPKDLVAHYAGLGLALGSGVGAALGAAFGNVGTGLGLGVALGLIIGAGIGAHKKKQKDGAQ